MKTLITLMSALIFLSATANADGIGKKKKKRNSEFSAVPTAQFVMGDPGIDAPIELAFIKAKNAMVPVAPFVWGDPSGDAPKIYETARVENRIIPGSTFCEAALKGKASCKRIMRLN